MVNVDLHKLLHLCRIVYFHYSVLCYLQHTNSGRVDRHFASQEEQIQHLLAKLLRRVVIAHHWVVHLTETTVTVQPKFVNCKEHFRDRLAYLFLELPNNLENVILSKDLFHSYDCLSVNNKNVPFVYTHHSIDVGLFDSYGLQWENDDVEQNVVHALCVLYAWVWRSIEHLSQKRNQVLVTNLLDWEGSFDVLLYLLFFLL